MWEDRPKISDEKAFLLKEKYSGESTESKLNRIREKLKKINSDGHLIASLDDICWILNPNF